MLPSALAQDSLCAEAKIEIKQKVSLERQAFDAVMKINNGLDGSTLTGIAVNLTFQDANGQPVLRLTADVLAGLGLAETPLEELAETRRWLRERAEVEVDWKKPWLSAVASSRRRIVVNRAEGGWIVLGGHEIQTDDPVFIAAEKCPEQ